MSPENNKGVICDKLVDVFGKQQQILEIGSGTGQHAVWIARHMPDLIWQTSDRAENLDFIRHRLEVEGPGNVLNPVELDVSSQNWPEAKYDGVFSANCIHIMGWENVICMFSGVGGVLNNDARLVLYGPFKFGGKFTTPSNAAFDEWLKANDPVSGVRDFEAVDGLAREIGLGLIANHAMPANNNLIVWG